MSVLDTSPTTFDMTSFPDLPDESFDLLRRLADMVGIEKVKVHIYSRAEGRVIPEYICGEGLMRLFYGTSLGLKLTTRLFVHRWLSYVGGKWYDTPLSRKQIQAFAQEMQIDLNECEKPLGKYPSFNSFFARKLKPGARPINSEPGALVSPGDGRLLVFPRIQDDTVSYLKWAPIRLLELFAHNRRLVEKFRYGSCAVLRLSPSDYHRFHFPAAGRVGRTVTVPGLLHSVNPYVLETERQVFAVNKRTICQLETQDFGPMVLMEIGAMGVGSIKQTTTSGSHVLRGQEKGYFKYGGSTTLLFAQEGRLVFDPDLVAHSGIGMETLVRMGERIALCR